MTDCWMSVAVIMNLVPVRVWRHLRVRPEPAVIVSMPSWGTLGGALLASALAFELALGDAWTAMAWREWKVEPILNESLVFRGGEEGDRAMLYMRPPDLFTMKRLRNIVL
eukprot:CAMPEP_0118637366 /NCGR_PEP_ID=MMETSP0785-20121206/3114_1 /TAXON_ID=91992 /ORGANISM="Bolidomonas pacifica, Strain CCMP 1866" /LENGTH=109 /DNA_ID=CAMNT_0006528547 /DNA_START=168 /DNA_END=497 /DNA_ORIENTATION=+